jgi:hypothetical protein
MPTVKDGTRVQVCLWVEPKPGVVTEVFKGTDQRTRYMIHLDNGQNLSTTVDALVLEVS